MAQVCRKILKWLQSILLRAQRAHLRHPRKFLSVAVILFVLCIIQANRLKVGIRAEDWLDQSLTSTQLYLELKETFGSEAKLSWLVPNEWSASELCKYQKYYFNWGLNETSIDKMSSIFDLRRPSYDSANETLFYYRELPENCEFNEAQIAGLKTHPLTDSLSVRPGHDLLLNFTFRDLDEPTKWGATDFVNLEKWIGKLKKIAPQSFFGGTLFFQESVRQGIIWAGILNIITGLVIVLCCRAFLGTWTSAFILLTLILFTTKLLQSGMSLRGDVADPLSASIFVIMTIAIVEDFFFSFYLARTQKIPLRRALRRMSLPSFFTSLTTAIGLGSLTTSSNMSVQNLGFWTGIGAMVEWGLVYLILLSACKIFPKLNELPWKGEIYFPQWFKSIGHFTPSRKLLLALTLPLFLIFVTYNKVNINYSPFDMFPSTHPLIQFRDYVKSERGFEGEASLVFNHEEMTQTDSELVQQIALHPQVASYKDPFQLKQALVPATADDSLKRMINYEIKQTTNIKDFEQNGKSRAILFLKNYDIQSLESLNQFTDKICQGRCYLTGEMVAFKDYALSMLTTLYSSFTLSLTSVSILLILLSLAVSGRIFWPLILSSMWAPLMLMICTSLFQIKINVVTCLAMDLMIGLSGDNAVQFLLFDRKGRWTKGHEELYPVGLMIVTTIALISLILVFSAFRTARILSGLMEFGAVLMLIGDLWILNYFTQVKKTNPKGR